MASLLEVKSRGVCSVWLCAKYRQESVTLSPYNQCQKIKKPLLLRWKIRCTAASWLHVCPPEVGHLIDICKPSIAVPSLLGCFSGNSISTCVPNLCYCIFPVFGGDGGGRSMEIDVICKLHDWLDVNLIGRGNWYVWVVMWGWICFVFFCFYCGDFFIFIFNVC